MSNAFNLSQLANNTNSSGQVALGTGVSGTLPIANGGTNSTATATAGGIGYGTGTAHAYTTAGTTGQVLTSNGASAPTWATASGGGLGGITVFTSNGTFTIPTGKTVVKVTVIGGGGGGGTSYTAAAGGGGGGSAIKYLTGLTPGNTLTVTRGAAGTGAVSSCAPTTGGTGGTSSVASGTQTITTISATGGAGGPASIGSGTFIWGGAGGTGSNGDINIPGSNGGNLSIGLGCTGSDVRIFGGGGLNAIFSTGQPSAIAVGSTAQSLDSVGYGRGGMGKDLSTGKA